MMKITDIDQNEEQEIKDKKEKEEKQNDTVVKNNRITLID